VILVVFNGMGMWLLASKRCLVSAHHAGVGSPWQHQFNLSSELKWNEYPGTPTLPCAACWFSHATTTLSRLGNYLLTSISSYCLYSVWYLIFLSCILGAQRARGEDPHGSSLLTRCASLLQAGRCVLLSSWSFHRIDRLQISISTLSFISI
jgi:hypothetical protein